MVLRRSVPARPGRLLARQYQRFAQAHFRRREAAEIDTAGNSVAGSRATIPANVVRSRRLEPGAQRSDVPSQDVDDVKADRGCLFYGVGNPEFPV